ncbi:MAG: glyoxalase superfamily protein [Pseudomonadota bacterium]
MTNFSAKNSPAADAAISALKEQARRLRVRAGRGALGHSAALERVAQLRGHRDWNTLRATVARRMRGCPVAPGQRVEGRYLGHPMSGNVVRAEPGRDSGTWSITLVFDQPVTVADLDGMTAARTRVSAVIDQNGQTAEALSTGTPHLALSLDTETA